MEFRYQGRWILEGEKSYLPRYVPTPFGKAEGWYCDASIDSEKLKVKLHQIQRTVYKLQQISLWKTEGKEGSNSCGSSDFFETLRGNII